MSQETKDEITSLPEGMSSDQLDEWTMSEEDNKPEVQESAKVESPPAEEPVKEELESEPKTETKVEIKPEEEPEPELSETEQQLMAKDAKIGDFRRRNREIELENARLKGELEARRSQTTEDTPKSPLERAEADYIEKYGSLDGFAINTELYRQQRAFEDKQVTEKTAKTDEERAITTMNREVDVLQLGDLSPEKVGYGADFRSVVEVGKKYLDKADVMKVEIVSHRDGIAAGVRKTYDLCKEAILAANNEDTKRLQLAMRSKSQPKPKKTDIDAIPTEGDDANKGEAEEETHSQRLTNFICG